jgi:TolA-binding protein
MKTIILFFVLMLGGIVYLHQSLEDGTILRYVDQHSHERGVPKATYLIGQSYYLFQDLENATTYFLRAAERYPNLSLGDDAYFSYLQCLDDRASVPRSQLIEGYKTYLVKYPSGRHAELARNRLDTYTTGAH